jgi:DHA1 family tetracycline resistance protein-like MFS transporter
MGGVKMLRDYPQIWGLVAVVFIANFAHYVYPSTFVLFADASYGWKEKQAGYVLSVVGVLSVIVNVLLVGRLVKALGERRAVMLGLACGTLGFLIYGLAGTGWVFMLGLPISALVGDRRTRDAGLDHQAGAGRCAGPHPGLDEQPGVAGRDLRAGAVRRFVRFLHRPARAGATARHRLPDRGADAGDRGVRGLALHRCRAPAGQAAGEPAA